MHDAVMRKILTMNGPAVHFRFLMCLKAGRRGISTQLAGPALQSLVAQDLGRITSIRLNRASGSKHSKVFWKKLPSKICPESLLATHNVTLDEYKETFWAPLSSNVKNKLTMDHILEHHYDKDELAVSAQYLLLWSNAYMQDKSSLHGVTDSIIVLQFTFNWLHSVQDHYNPGCTWRGLQLI